MRLVDAGTLDLGVARVAVARHLAGGERETATVLDLLAHSAGLPGHRPYYEARSGRVQYERAIASEPLEYAPGTGSLYSDLGFILLGFILEDAGGASLAAQTEAAFSAIGGSLDVWFGVPGAFLARTAPTAAAPELLGVVDDGNARALGGVAGHAGLFGTADGVGRLAASLLAALAGVASIGWLASPATIERFTTRANRISSRALAWDTMLPTSSCGTRLSERAFGHTGFTGASLSMNPRRKFYVVLLTNRVFPQPGSSDGITAFRRSLHDAVAEDLA